MGMGSKIQNELRLYLICRNDELINEKTSFIVYFIFATEFLCIHPIIISKNSKSMSLGFFDLTGMCYQLKQNELSIRKSIAIQSSDHYEKVLIKTKFCLQHLETWGNDEMKKVGSKQVFRMEDLRTRSLLASKFQKKHGSRPIRVIV